MQNSYKKIAAEAFETFTRIYLLLKSKRLSANTKLTLYKALIRSVMTYACLACEFVAYGHLFKLQNQVLRIIGNLSRRTSTRDLHVAFIIPYVYDSVTKLCRQQAQNRENISVLNIGQNEAQYRKCKKLKIGGG